MMRFLALLVMVVCAMPALAQEVYNLRPKFVEGKQTRYEYWTQRHYTGTSRFEDNEHSFSTVMEFTGEITWTVDKVAADGSATCLMTFDWMAMTMRSDTGDTTTIDSRKASGDDERVHSLFKAIAGFPLRVRVNADGSVRDVANAKEIERRAGKDATVPEERDFIESATELAVLSGVPESLTIGKSWNQRYVWDRQMGDLHADTQYTLDSVEEIEGIPIANVSSTAKLRFEFDKPKASGGPAYTMRMTDASLTSQTMFDLQRHEAVGRNSIESRKIELTASLNGRSMKTTIEEVTQSQALRIAE